jgi:nucleotide-binding universal stress UspA family protein
LQGLLGIGKVIARSPRMRTTFTHVLVPLDLSTKNERTLAIALDVAAQNGARVTLLHVIQRIEGMPQTELRDFYRRLEERAHKRLTLVARRFVARKLRTTQSVVVGTPAREIVGYAATKKVDLIVINSHQVIDLDRPGEGLGTTSYKVAILCRCPVMLVK